MKIIGHRGARGLAPENSLEAIRKAMKLRVDMIEIDVRLQAGVVVLSHEPVRTGHIYCPLRQVLDEIKGKIPLNIEIKEKKVIPQLLKTLKDYEGEVLFSSFKYPILADLKKRQPDAAIAVLEKWSGVRAIAEASLLETNRLHLQHKWLWESFIRSLKHKGYSVYAYTVDTRERAEELASWGIDGIFTDMPNRFR